MQRKSVSNSVFMFEVQVTFGGPSAIPLRSLGLTFGTTALEDHIHFFVFFLTIRTM